MLWRLEVGIDVGPTGKFSLFIFTKKSKRKGHQSTFVLKLKRSKLLRDHSHTGPIKDKLRKEGYKKGKGIEITIKDARVVNKKHKGK